MGSPIAKDWIYTTVRIRNEWGGTGTGFLVGRAVGEHRVRVFLATNKHVLHNDPEKREGATKVDLDFNVQSDKGEITGKSLSLALRANDGSKIWREHPDPDIDVLAVDITGLYTAFSNIVKKWAGYDVFVDSKKLEESDITIGDDVMVVGYPSGLTQGTTNFPLVRAGVISTRIGERFEDDFREPNGTVRRRSIRGFLIDGATIPGSSGSPVVLRPIVGRYVKGNIALGVAPPLLLGIVAETRYAPAKTSTTDSLSFAGLGLAYDAETVKETVELFFPQGQ